MSPIEKIKELPNWIKTLTAVVAFVMTIVGGVIAMEDRYVNQAEAAQTLMQVQQSLTTQMKMYRYDFIDDQYEKAKDKYDAEPNNPVKKREYEELKEKRTTLRKELGLE